LLEGEVRRRKKKKEEERGTRKKTQEENENPQPLANNRAQNKTLSS
jgi:hypothetical protein